MVSVDNNYVYSGILFKLFQSCGKSFVTLILTVIGEVAGDKDIPAAFFLGLFECGIKKRVHLVVLTCSVFAPLVPGIAEARAVSVRPLEGVGIIVNVGNNSHLELCLAHSECAENSGRQRRNNERRTDNNSYYPLCHSAFHFHLLAFLLFGAARRVFLYENYIKAYKSKSPLPSSAMPRYSSACAASMLSIFFNLLCIIRFLSCAATSVRPASSIFFFALSRTSPNFSY